MKDKKETKKETKKTLKDNEIKDTKTMKMETENDAAAVSINEFTSGINFEHSVEKYKDNMSTAITFFLCGIAGIVILVLNWFGVINIITGKDASSMVIYISLLVLFIVFIGIAIYSLKAANKVKSKIKSENSYTDEITEWVENNIIPEIVDASYIGDDLPMEIKYFERSAYITNAIKKQFPDAPADLVDNITDEYIETMFHEIERALAEEKNAQETDDTDDTDDTDNDE